MKYLLIIITIVFIGCTTRDDTKRWANTIIDSALVINRNGQEYFAFNNSNHTATYIIPIFKKDTVYLHDTLFANRDAFIKHDTF